MEVNAIKGTQDMCDDEDLVADEMEWSTWTSTGGKLIEESRKQEIRTFRHLTVYEYATEEEYRRDEGTRSSQLSLN